MKIRIVGCSGTGKSTLANKISDKYHIPKLDLDDIFWDKSESGYSVKNSEERRNELLNDYLINDSWIIEGVYYGWCNRSFDEADIIYFLDYKKYIYYYRIIKRFILRKLHIIEGKNESFASMIDLLKWTDKFQKVHRLEIEKILNKYDNKVSIIKSPKQLNKELMK